MTKLVIQIPCYNEEGTIAKTIKDIPKKIAGISKIEILVIDDGSCDNTSKEAKKSGAKIKRLNSNRGLAKAFAYGVDEALSIGADIIVNIDGDNQYQGKDIEKLIKPIIKGEADIVIGDRCVESLEEYSWIKRKLHKIGSYFIKKLSGIDVPDPVSGFRAISKNAAAKINIMSSFSYTTEMIIQAGHKDIILISVPIKTNKTRRPSRLFGSIPEFVAYSAITILRTYIMYKPLRSFLFIGAFFMIVGAIPIIRFLYFYFLGSGDGHIQSLVIGGMLLIVGFISFLTALLADVLAGIRRMQERIIERFESKK